MRMVILLTETLWPSGLRRWLKAPFRKGVGSNPTGVILLMGLAFAQDARTSSISYSVLGGFAEGLAIPRNP